MEFYDEELGIETYRNTGIATLMPMQLDDKADEEAMNQIALNTSKHLENNKFVVSLGAEHTITYGCFKAYSGQLSGCKRVTN